VAQIGIGRGMSCGGSSLDEMRREATWGFTEDRQRDGSK
jgi:hypothetical protein